MTTKPTRPLIDTYKGDGSPAWIHDNIIRPLLKQTGTGLFGQRDFDWSAENRIRTDGNVVTDSIAKSKELGTAVVKYPGATPDDVEFPYLKALTGADP